MGPANRHLDQSHWLEYAQYTYGHDEYDGHATWELLEKLPPTARVNFCAKYRRSVTQQQCDRCFILQILGCDLSKEKKTCAACASEIARGKNVDCMLAGKIVGELEGVDYTREHQVAMRYNKNPRRDVVSCDDCALGAGLGCDVDTELNIGCSACRDASKSCFTFGQLYSLRSTKDADAGTWPVHKHRCDQCAARRIQCNWTSNYLHGDIRCYNCWGGDRTCSRDDVQIRVDGSVQFYTQLASLEMNTDRIATQELNARVPDSRSRIIVNWQSDIGKRQWRPANQVYPWADGNIPPEMLTAYPGSSVGQHRHRLAYMIQNMGGCDLCKELGALQGMRVICSRKGGNEGGCDRCSWWGVDCSLSIQGVRQYFPRDPNLLARGSDQAMAWEPCKHCVKADKPCDRQIPCQSCYDHGRGEDGCRAEEKINGKNRTRIGAFRRKLNLGGVMSAEYWIGCGYAPQGPGHSWAEVGISKHRLQPARNGKADGKRSAIYQGVTKGRPCFVNLPSVRLVNGILNNYRATRPGRVSMFNNDRAQNRPNRVMGVALPTSEIPVLPSHEIKEMNLIFEDGETYALPRTQAELNHSSKVGWFFGVPNHTNLQRLFERLRKQTREDLLDSKLNADPFSAPTKRADSERDQPEQASDGEMFPGPISGGIPAPFLDASIEALFGTYLQDNQGIEVNAGSGGQAMPAPSWIREMELNTSPQLMRDVLEPLSSSLSPQAMNPPITHPYRSGQSRMFSPHDLHQNPMLRNVYIPDREGMQEQVDTRMVNMMETQKAAALVVNRRLESKYSRFNPAGVPIDMIVSDSSKTDLGSSQMHSTSLSNADSVLWQAEVGALSIANANEDRVHVGKLLELNKPLSYGFGTSQAKNNNHNSLHLVKGDQPSTHVLDSIPRDAAWPPIGFVAPRPGIGQDAGKCKELIPGHPTNSSQEIHLNLPVGSFDPDMMGTSQNINSDGIPSTADEEEEEEGVRLCGNQTRGAKCEHVGHKQSSMSSEGYHLCEECTITSSCEVVAKWRYDEIMDMRVYACAHCAQNISSRYGNEMAMSEDMTTAGKMSGGWLKKDLYDHHHLDNDDDAAAAAAGVWGMKKQTTDGDGGDGQVRKMFGKFVGLGKIRPVTGCDCAEKLLNRCLCSRHRHGCAKKLAKQTAMKREWMLGVWGGKIMCPFCREREGAKEHGGFKVKGQNGGGEKEHNLRAWKCLGCAQFVVLGPWNEGKNGEEYGRGKNLLVDKPLPGWETLLPRRAFMEMGLGDRPQFAREKGMVARDGNDGEDGKTPAYDGFKGPLERQIALGVKERMDEWFDLGVTGLEGLDPNAGIAALRAEVGVGADNVDTEMFG